MPPKKKEVDKDNFLEEIDIFYNLKEKHPKMKGPKLRLGHSKSIISF